MPTETVASFEIPYRQVLAPDGTVDTALEPDLSAETLRELYEQMYRARRMDERAVSLQRRGELGTYAPGTGQEAAQVGSALACRPADWTVPSFREQAVAIARGTPPRKVFEYAMGLEEGAEIPEGTNALPPSIPVGSQAIHAAGIGWGEAMRGRDAVAVGYFGDGATSQGDVYEGLNCAGVFDAQTVFVCQNNQWAISTPRRTQTRAETLAQKAVAAGIDGIQVDGNDVLGVYAAVEEALASARDGDPVLVEALTYRRSMHTTSDDPSRYRPTEEVAEWEAKDPLVRYEAYLRERGLLDDERVEAIEADVEAELDEAIAAAKETKADADPADMFRYAYADLPASVADQLEAFQAARGEDDGE